MQQHDTSTARLYGLQAIVLKTIEKAGESGISRSGLLAKARHRTLPTVLETYLDDLQFRQFVQTVRNASERYGEKFGITQAGRAALKAHQERMEMAEIYSQPAPPPTRDIFSGIYTPDSTGFVRNDGHKHLHSAGASRC